MMPDLECMEAARERFANWTPADRRIVAAEAVGSSEPKKEKRPETARRLSYTASRSARERWRKAASEDDGICRFSGEKHKFHRAGYHAKTKAPKKRCRDCKQNSVIRPGDIVSGIQY